MKTTSILVLCLFSSVVTGGAAATANISRLRNRHSSHNISNKKNEAALSNHQQQNNEAMSQPGGKNTKFSATHTSLKNEETVERVENKNQLSSGIEKIRENQNKSEPLSEQRGDANEEGKPEVTQKQPQGTTNISKDSENLEKSQNEGKLKNDFTENPEKNDYHNKNNNEKLEKENTKTSHSLDYERTECPEEENGEVQKSWFVEDLKNKTNEEVKRENGELESDVQPDNLAGIPQKQEDTSRSDENNTVSSVIEEQQLTVSKPTVQGNKEVTTEANEATKKETPSDHNVEEEGYPALPGPIQIFERQLRELNHNLTAYLQRVVLEFGDKMKDGIEELGIPVLDPLPLPDHNISPSVEGEVFSTRFSRVVVKGLSNYKVQELRSNLQSLRIMLTTHFPLLYTDCFFSTNGSLLEVFSVTGEGHMLLEFFDVYARIVFYVKREDKKVQIRATNRPYVDFSTAQVRIGGQREKRRLTYNRVSQQLAPMLFWTFSNVVIKETNHYFTKYFENSLANFEFPDYFFDLPLAHHYLRFNLNEPIPNTFNTHYTGVIGAVSWYDV